MDLKNFYENAYSNSQDIYTPNESLQEFLQMQLPVLNTLPPARVVLELGCGEGTNLLGRSEVWAVDFSDTAINRAKEDERFQYTNFICEDVVELNLEQKFDLILDSHLLHCIVDQQNRQKYLNNVKDHLSAGALFYVETMVTHRDCTFESELEHFFFEPILQKGDDPIRYIDTPENIEKEFLAAGLKIIYFYIDAGKRMIPIEQREQALRTDPFVLRIIATKNLED